MDNQKIIENFFKIEDELIESEYKDKILKHREDYKNEINSPVGCSACKKNALRRKYSSILKGILEKNDS